MVQPRSVTPVTDGSARHAVEPIPAQPPAASVSAAHLPGDRHACCVARLRRRVFPGRPEQVATARTFTRRALADLPCVDDAVVCVSELATNAVRHTRSGAGGTFTVLVWPGRSATRLAVLDDGADTVPAPVDDPLAATGRGLLLVASLSDRWGHYGSWNGRIVWCVLGIPCTSSSPVTR